VSVYWFTHTFSTAMWHYRASYGRPEDRDPEDLMTQLREVPVGYSQFPKELFPSPAVWVKEKVDLVWHRRHEKVIPLVVLWTRLTSREDTSRLSNYLRCFGRMFSTS
jgi:hypothetical protein